MSPARAADASDAAHITERFGTAWRARPRSRTLRRVESLRPPPPAPPARPRGRRPIPPERQRARLLEAARSELRRSDFASIRVSEVVRTAGMSSRSFYDHFASKEELLIALIHESGRELVAQVDHIFATEPDPVARVDRALDVFLAAFAGTPLDVEKLAESASRRVQELQRHYVGEIASRVEGELDRVWRAGLIQRRPEPLVVEVLLLGMLGLASRYVAEGRADELSALRPQLSAFLVRTLS